MPVADPAEVAAIEDALSALHHAVSQQHSIKRCHELWSKFVRTRDGKRCAACPSTERLQAHHICRKSFLAEARFQPGNGITLCWDCHRDQHRGFNGRANLKLPMDAQGGEKIETIPTLLGVSINHARKRGILRDDFYFLSDLTLAKFKLFQGFEPYDEFPGLRIEQAYGIWEACPQHTLRAVLSAVLFS